MKAHSDGGNIFVFGVWVKAGISSGNSGSSHYFSRFADRYAEQKV